eukprot:UN23608
MENGWCSEENAGRVGGNIGGGLGGQSGDPCFNWQCYQDLTFDLPDHTADTVVIDVWWTDGGEPMIDEWTGFSDVIVGYFPLVYQWDHDEWSHRCSMECGTQDPNRTRTVICYDLTDGNTVSDDNCDPMSRPIDSEVCPMNPPCPEWVAGEWSHICEPQCGRPSLERTRTVTCEGESF